MSKFYYLIIISITSLIMLNSCKSSFPATGTIVECNGQFLIPILNPSTRAEFPGGEEAMFKFFEANLKAPQEDSNYNKIKGKIRVAFIITEEGKICDIRITSKPKEYFDNEVIRVMNIMPRWIPAVNEGKIVNSYCLLDFKL